MVGFVAYPVSVKGSDVKAPFKGFVAKAAAEADFQLPRWMVPNSTIRMAARLICRNLYYALTNQSKKWDDSPYPARSKENPVLILI